MASERRSRSRSRERDEVVVETPPPPPSQERLEVNAQPTVGAGPWLKAKISSIVTLHPHLQLGNREKRIHHKFPMFRPDDDYEEWMRHCLVELEIFEEELQKETLFTAKDFDIIQFAKEELFVTIRGTYNTQALLEDVADKLTTASAFDLAVNHSVVSMAGALRETLVDVIKFEMPYAGLPPKGKDAAKWIACEYRLEGASALETDCGNGCIQTTITYTQCMAGRIRYVTKKVMDRHSQCTTCSEDSSVHGVWTHM